MNLKMRENVTKKKKKVQQCLRLGGMSGRLVVILGHLMKGVNVVFSNLPEATGHAGHPPLDLFLFILCQLYFVKSNRN